jgi:phage baseplate assembly protein W
MPIPQTIRVNPLDLQNNIAIGIALPFNGPGVFNSTYSTRDQIKSNLINLLLTNKGERIMNPEFGADLKTVLFEGMVEELDEQIKRLIVTNVSIFVPEIQTEKIYIDQDRTSNTVSVTIEYKIILSGVKDQITVQFI